MATIHANSDGVVVFLGGLPYSLPISPPASATQSLEFDPDTNRPLATDLHANSHLYRLNAGVLTRNGVTVTVNPDGPGERDRKRLQEIWAALNSTDPLTQNQLKAILRYIVRQLVTEFRNS